MKNKLLFSTALVAASLSYAGMANAVRYETNLTINEADDGVVYTAGTDRDVDYEHYTSSYYSNDATQNPIAGPHPSITVKSDLTFSNFKLSDGIGGVLGNFHGNTLNIGDGVTFENNKATDGGAVWSQGAKESGGNTFEDRYVKSTLKVGNGVKFIGNEATGTGSLGIGGAVLLMGNQEATFGDNILFEDNTSVAGALAVQSTHVSATSSDGKVKATFGKNATFTGNKAKTGGAIYNRSDGSSGATYGTEIIFGEGATFTENEATVGSGGAIRNTFNGTESPVVITFVNGATFTDNSAVTKGGAIANEGTMNFGNVTFEGNTAAQGKDISNAGTINFNGDVTLGNGADRILNTGTINFANSNLTADFDGSSVITGTAGTITGSANFSLSGLDDDEIENGSIVLEGNQENFNLTNTLYKFTVGVNDENNPTIYTYQVESKKDAGEIAESTGADANQAAAISAVTDGANTGNAAFNNVANNISEMLQSGDDAQVQAALDLVTAMSPEAAPMVASVSTENVAQVFSAIANRLSGGALAAANQGMSSGDSLLERGAAWVQGLFNHAKLDKTANNDGFKADTAGLALGFEKQVSDETKVGLGYAYNNSDVKSAMRKTDVDTHSVFAYGEYKPSNWFVNGMLSHNWSRYDEKTPVSTAKHDAETLGLQMMTGYNMLMGNVTVTPEAGLRYVHVDQEAYTTSLGANVGGDKSDILTGVMGVNVAKNWTLDNGMTLKPEARLALTYDIKHDAANSTVLLPNGSSYTVEGKALDRFGVEAGLGLTAELNDNWDLTVGYEGKFRDDYRDHTGLLNLKYKF